MLKHKRMVLIEVYTGLRRSLDKKMDQLREKCGQDHQDILVIGEIIVKKDLVFNFIKIVTNMKVCGLWIKNTDKELIGEWMVVNLEENILVIGLRIKSMVEGHSSSKIVIDMMVTG